MAKLTINHQALQALQALQDQANAKLREIVWQVRNEMVGKPADLVYKRLVSRLGTAGIKPNEPEMRKIARAIEMDELTK